MNRVWMTTRSLKLNHTCRVAVQFTRNTVLLLSYLKVNWKVTWYLPWTTSSNGAFLKRRPSSILRKKLLLEKKGAAQFRRQRRSLMTDVYFLWSVPYTMNMQSRFQPTKPKYVTYCNKNALCSYSLVCCVRDLLWKFFKDPCVACGMNIQC